MGEEELCDDVHYNVLFDSIRARKFAADAGEALRSTHSKVPSINGDRKKEKQNKEQKKIRTSLRSHRSYNQKI